MRIHIPLDDPLVGTGMQDCDWEGYRKTRDSLNGMSGCAFHGPLVAPHVCDRLTRAT